MAEGQDRATGRQGGLSAGDTSGRIALLDALRALALFGILQVNIQSYLWGAGALTLFAAAPSSADRVTFLLVCVLVYSKFVALFAFIFGHGFALQMRSLRTALADERAARSAYRRRLLFLLLLGIAHGCLLYFGDILTLYASVGFLLVLYASSRPRRLARHAVFALGTYAVMTAVFAISVALYDRAAPPTSAQIPADALKRFAVASDGSYSQYLSANVTDYLAMLGAAAFVLPFVLGMFLLGALAARQGWLTQPARHARLWRRAAWLGAVMLPLAAGLGWAAFDSSRQWPELLGGPASVALSLTFPITGLYLALILAKRDTGWMRAVIGWLAPAGRMPLTNYLSQSVLMGLLLSGWGLGWGKDLGVAALALLALGIVVAQVVASRIWMARFGTGPVETLWRRATYGTRNPR
jgi:uncharacterized protein